MADDPKNEQPPPPLATAEKMAALMNPPALGPLAKVDTLLNTPAVRALTKVNALAGQPAVMAMDRALRALDGEVTNLPHVIALHLDLLLLEGHPSQSLRGQREVLSERMTYSSWVTRAPCGAYTSARRLV